jgi:hypothetical protein
MGNAWSHDPGVGIVYISENETQHTWSIIISHTLIINKAGVVKTLISCCWLLYTMYLSFPSRSLFI